MNLCETLCCLSKLSSANLIIYYTTSSCACLNLKSRVKLRNLEGWCGKIPRKARFLISMYTVAVLFYNLFAEIGNNSLYHNTQNYFVHLIILSTLNSSLIPHPNPISNCTIRNYYAEIQIKSAD